jgi:hypothetical protein
MRFYRTHGDTLAFRPCEGNNICEYLPDREKDRNEHSREKLMILEVRERRAQCRIDADNLREVRTSLDKTDVAYLFDQVRSSAILDSRTR